MTISITNQSIQINSLTDVNHNQGLKTDNRQDICIHQIFETQVQQTPDDIAVVFENQQLTYRHLNQQANQLANYLRALGVKPDVLVGICMERSLEMVVGILGILKAGGAYVPLDPTYPSERLAFILEDTQTPVMLTQEKLVKNLPDSKAQIICLDSDWEVIAQSSQENLVNEVTVDHLMYVIYTSGSTGQPKGVMIPHRGICNMLYWRQINFRITKQDKVLQTISFSFDPSVWQIFWPLCFGGQLIMARPGGHQDSAYLVKTIVEQQITILGLVPSILRVLVEEKGIENCQSLRHVATGGEALPIDLMERFKERLNLENFLLNCYGPTEASIDVTFWICQRGTNRITAPIGRPITNTQIYILDEDLQPMPVGEAGELHIGGMGLARGYLNRPELTDEKFISNPFNDFRLPIHLQASRLYKTGDLARYLPDGNIEFLGRIDHQVKIRGFRVELGEIEATLSQHPAVQQTLVMMREDVPDDKRLVAYVVVNLKEVIPSQVIPSQSELRQFLAGQLPDYMVPTAFVFLDTLPLNPNGKVDRRALPAPDTSSFSRSNNFVAPRNVTEQLLATIWEEVLGLPDLGINDNFFALGGNSLLATKVISRCRQAFGQEILLQVLFEKPTISGLASSLSFTDAESNTTDIRISPQAHRKSAPLSFAQQRVWFLEQLEPNSPAYIIANAQRLTGKLNVTILQQSLDAIAAHHQALRTNFISSADGSPIQVIGSPRSVELMVLQLEQNQDQELQSILNREAQRPFNLASDLMLRGTLLKIGEDEHILLLVMHHIAADGWSLGILWKQLAAAYEAFSNNQPSPLPNLPIQYADFAIWQRQWLSGEVLNTKLEYWKKQLFDAEHVLELPTDKPRPPIQTYRGATQSLTIPETLRKSLAELSRQEGVTMFMTLLAAFATLLHRYTGQEDLSIGSPVAGRNRAEIEGLIGFFINTVILRTNFSSNPSFSSLLNQVRQTALDAYAHQDMPFEKLVEELQPERDLSRNPLFQVWFNMLNFEDTQWLLPGLSVEPVSLLETASKFDLTLYVTEQKQGIQLEFVYNADLFNADTMQWLLEHYQTLLQGIIANPKQQISTLPLLTQEQRYLLNSRSNVVYPTNRFIQFEQQDIEQSIPARFEQQVRKYPHNVAVHTKNFHWTYTELNQQANRVAQAIWQQCTSKEEKIALLFEHDAPMIAGILGVLKVGKTYVPLDPNYPIERISYILDDSLASVVLTNDKNLARAQELTKGTIDIINIDQINFTGFSDEIKQEISPDTIAYILYTSGSTGQPKGVIQNHRNVLHFIRNYTNNLHINEQDGLTLLSSYSFDAAVMDIFAAILNGASLYPINVKEEGLTDLSQWLQQQKITIYHSTPTLYRHFLGTLNGEQKLPQRLVVLGGEEVVKTDVDLYKKHFSDECIFVNGLGPTESTVTLQYFINQQTQSRYTVPVGYPVEETEILLLNQAGEKTDIYGEIAIRSPHIALGYWQKNENTRTVFLPDSEYGGSRRIYRTGDLGRLRPDGSIEFLGRKDFQVKIRGFRIELGEIVAVLTQHPSVSETVVMVREDVPGNKQLVAYVVAVEIPTTNELRHLLKQKLPDYMVPSSFVFLDTLPLTPSGKVDRRALKAPVSKEEREVTFVAPGDDLEYQLVQIWQQVLGVQSIGIKDNFFDLGGHSLLAIELFAQIQQKFGQKLPLVTLFQSGTVEALADLLRQALASDHQHTETTLSSLVPIQPLGSKPPLFCVHALGGGVLAYHSLALHLGLDQPFYGLQPQGLDGKLPPLTNVEDMASLYIREIQTIQPHGPYFLAGYSFGGVVALEMAQQLRKQGEKVDTIAMIDSCVPNSSTRSPFWQRVFVHLDNLRQQGPAYLTRKLVGWSQHSQHILNERYKEYMNFLGIKEPLPEDDKHLEVMNANIEALNKYRFSGYSGRIVLFRTADTTRSEAVGKRYDPQFGWGKVVTSPIDVYHLPGSHVGVIKEPHVRVLAEKLQHCLENAYQEYREVLPKR